MGVRIRYMAGACVADDQYFPVSFWSAMKSEYHSSLILEGTFKKDSVITVNVQQVSIRSTLQIKLDDAEILNKDFLCGPDPGEDWTQIISTEWGYQNISGKDYSVTLPADGSRLTITNTDGDWMTFNSSYSQIRCG